MHHLKTMYVLGRKYLRDVNRTMEKLSEKFEGNRDCPIYDIVRPLPPTSPIREVPQNIPRPPYAAKHKFGEEDAPYKILIKKQKEIDAITASCSLARSVLDALGKYARVGRTTDELDSYAHNLIIEKGAYPSPLGFGGFPRSICTSVNNIVVHGIPDDRKLKNGDIITIDVTVYYKGYHGDCAETYLIGEVDDPGKRLVKAARKALQCGIEACAPGVPFHKIGRQVENAASRQGLSVVPSVAGHGIGRFFHERPDILHFRNETCEEEEEIMLPGMVFTIEPALTEGSVNVEVYPDQWTVSTSDDSRTAQFEHTVLITNTSCEVLTR